MVLCRADTSSERPAELRMTSTINRATFYITFYATNNTVLLLNYGIRQHSNTKMIGIFVPLINCKYVRTTPHSTLLQRNALQYYSTTVYEAVSILPSTDGRSLQQDHSTQQPPQPGHILTASTQHTQHTFQTNNVFLPRFHRFMQGWIDGMDPIIHAYTTCTQLHIVQNHLVYVKIR